MGCFSWLFSDNGKALQICRPGFLICPDNTVLYEPEYDGYGNFAGQDAYDLVAIWNREYLSQHPDFVIPAVGNIYDSSLKEWVTKRSKMVKDYPWWKFYADTERYPTPKDVASAYKQDFRNIGIDIACYDIQNQKLPFPIKICSKLVPYDSVPASVGDPNQGFGFML